VPGDGLDREFVVAVSQVCLGRFLHVDVGIVFRRCQRQQAFVLLALGLRRWPAIDRLGDNRLRSQTLRPDLGGDPVRQRGLGGRGLPGLHWRFDDRFPLFVFLVVDRPYGAPREQFGKQDENRAQHETGQRRDALND